MTLNAENLAVVEAPVIDHKAVGKLFQQKREEKGLTIAAVSSEIHIRQLYLKSIENGDLDALPGHIYKVGFIKNYANFLGLDSHSILADLLLLEEIVSDYSSFNYAIPVEKQRRPGIKTTLAALTLLFVAGVALYITEERTNHDAEALVDLSSSIDVGKQEHVQLGDVEPASSKQGLNVTAVPDLAVAPIETVTKENAIPTFEVTPLTDDLSIKVLAVKDAWVQISDESGKAVFVRLMRAGETYSVPSDGKFKLNTGNGGGVKLTIGSKTSDLIGEEGKVIRGVDLSRDAVEKLVK